MSKPRSDGPAARWGGPAAYASTGGEADAQARLDAIARQAAEALARARGDLARPLVETLVRAAPNHELVRHYQRQLAVVEFPWSLPRAPYVPASREAPDAACLDLVAFHVDVAAAPSGIHAPVDYAQVLALSFESARIRAPHARRILLTDEATRVPESIAVDEVRRFPLDASILMYERMRVQELYLAERAAGRMSVLMDSDVVVNRDPTPIFAEDFDIGLTWRPGFADAPFNGGMIFVGEGTRAAGFFRATRACYDALAADAALVALFPRSIRGWWGDQFALAATIGLAEFAERSTEGLAVDGTRVRFFPCESHNFTLEPNVPHSPVDLRRKFFVHFKGNRKSLQSQYLEHMRSGTV